MNQTEKYSAYKESGIEWLGEIPRHWTILKIKQLFFEKKKTQDINLNCGAISYGKVVRKDNNTVPIETKKSYQVVTSGDFLINPLNLNFDLVSLRIALSEIDVVVSSGYIVLNTLPKIDINKNYFKWLLHRYDVAFMKTLGSGVRQTLNFPQIGKSLIVVPPLQEQTQIATYLDQKTSQIDQAITQKENLIALLKEQKQISINEAVTKGLDKNVTLKDSGVEWIGEIPEHWRVERLGSNFIQRKEKVSDKEFKPLSVTKNGVVPQLDNAAKTNDGDNRKLVRKGDFVINSRSDRKGSSGLSKLDGSVSLINIVLKPINLNPEFSHIVLKSNGFIEEFYRNGHGIVADLWTTRFWDMKSIMLVIPPKQEQLQIVEYIETQTSKIDKAINLQENYISKLKEYKASLIDSVVTGKVKVSS